MLEITITRDLLVQAMHVYNTNVLNHPEDYSPFTGTMADAEGQADEIIRLLHSIR